MKTIKYSIIILVAIVLIYTLYSNLPFYSPSPNHRENTVLLSTNWTGSGPYAAFTPEPESNTMGCWSTALAQIMYHHKLIPHGKVKYTCSKGYEIDENLSDFTIIWDNFADQIKKDTPDSISQQIAEYCYASALVVQKDFGRGRYMTMMPSKKIIEKHLPVKAQLYLQYKGLLQGKRKIRNLVIHEIELGNPVFFYYRNMDVKGSGHAVVIDGYRFENDKFMVHLNFGWGGEKNGWFSMFKDIATPGDKNLRFWLTLHPQK